jgi:acyl carrier protein
MDSIDKLKASFVETLNVSPAGKFDELAYGATQGWDSVAHMNLISSLEEKFDVMLPTEDVIDMSSFLKAQEILRKHGVSF